MDTQPDYFTLLGLDADADFDDAALKAAYRKAARDSHPDAGGSEARFQAVGEAYENLKDPDRRRLYRAELALREVRNQLPKRYVPASDYLPYVFSVLDPSGVHSGPGSSAARPSNVADDTDAGGDGRQATPNRPTYSDDESQQERFASRARAAAQARTAEVLDQEITRRLAALRTVPVRWQLAGAFGGLVAGWLGVVLWNLGVLATVFGIGAGDAFGFGTYDPEAYLTPTARSGWQFVGALVGWQTVTRLVRIRRRFRVDDRALGAVVAAVLAVGWSWPWLLANPAVMVVVAVVAVTGLQLWRRRRGRRFLDTDLAREFGLRIDDSSGRDRIGLDARTVNEVTEEVHRIFQRTVR